MSYHTLNTCNIDNNSSISSRLSIKNFEISFPFKTKCLTSSPFKHKKYFPILLKKSIPGNQNYSSRVNNQFCNNNEYFRDNVGIYAINYFQTKHSKWNTPSLLSLLGVIAGGYLRRGLDEHECVLGPNRQVCPSLYLYNTKYHVLMCLLSGVLALSNLNQSTTRPISEHSHEQGECSDIGGVFGYFRFQGAKTPESTHILQLSPKKSIISPVYYVYFVLYNICII